jgi:uncharacterized protein YdaT
MLAGLATTAAKMAAPALFAQAGQYFSGKQAENIGGYNTNQSEQERAKARSMNQDPSVQGNMQRDSSNQAASDQQGRSRADQIFSNQLDASNKRADLQNQLTAGDQVIEANRGTQLANNYVQSARDQANASQGIINSIMNRQAASYGVSGLR